jgi:RNA polymerase sigma-70 factor (ECF subfamily)
MVEFDDTRNDDLYFNSPLPNEQLDNDETLRRVEAAIARLSPQHRTVLELHAMDNLSCEEVAKRLACSIGTVLSRLFYARKRLKDILKRAL